MSKKDFSVALKYVEARPRSQRRKGAEARVSGISVVGSGASATDLSLLQANLISVTNNFTALKDLFDSMFEKDSDGNIHAKLSLWSSGGITAGGVGSGGSGGGGGISYNRLDSWSDYSADKAGYVLSALLGNDLNTRLISVENAGYITQSALAPYALRSEIPSLVGYATQSWVEGKKYLTGITSAMVTTALGYTPYNSANFTKDNLKSTLGISDWALAATKPTYTASEVGALSVNGTAQSALKMTPEYLTDLNNATPWRFFDMNTGYGSADGNKPNIAWVSGITGTVAGSSNYRWQLAATTGNARPYFRQESKGNWSNWRTLAFTSDIPTKLSQLTDDVVAGKYLLLSGGTVNGDLKVSGVATLGSLVRLIETDGSTLYKVIQRNSGGNILLGSDYTRDLYIDFDKVRVRSNGTIFSREVTAPTFVGNLTGTADRSFTQAVIYGNRDVNLWDTDASAARYFALTDAAPNTPSDVYALGSILMEYSWDTNAGFQMISNNAGNTLLYRSRWNGTFKDWREIAFTDSNVASATKLQTSRSIWGQSFDGTQDVTGALTAPSITTNSLTIGGATLTYDSANEALCINGNMYALGGITAGGAGISTYSSLEARVARLEQQLNIS